jgi:hypothetical protein
MLLEMDITAVAHAHATTIMYANFGTDYSAHVMYRDDWTTPAARAPQPKRRTTLAEFLSSGISDEQIIDVINAFENMFIAMSRCNFKIHSNVPIETFLLSTAYNHATITMIPNLTLLESGFTDPRSAPVIRAAVSSVLIRSNQRYNDIVSMFSNL